MTAEIIATPREQADYLAEVLLELTDAGVQTADAMESVLEAVRAGDLGEARRRAFRVYNGIASQGACAQVLLGFLTPRSIEPAEIAP